MSLALYLALVRLSFSDPVAAAERVTSLLDSSKARWLAFGAVIAVGAALGLLGEILFSLVTGVDLGPAASPFLMAAIQGALLLYSAFAMAFFGRQFGGQGRFGEAFALMIWIQAIMVGAQLMQVAVMLMFPIIGVLMTLVLFGVMLWLITLFTAALHGFENLMLTGIGVVVVFFGSAMLIGSGLLATGLSPVLLTES
ncbi:YIP1 family protein [Rhodobacter capsulatus]|uniref:YIP1 family protein n=1 Tax=Rhodobacter capsulatus TaxID=1061 RepID=UPI004024E4F3